VSARRDEEGHKLVSEIRKTGAEAEFIHADVRREEDVRNLIDKTVERFGRLDIAVNTAGTEGVPGPITEQTADSYAATFDTNVLGTLLSMKHELRVMLPQKNGSIVNISSTYGHTGAPGASIYSASKHAVEGLTKSAALEAAGTGVRGNARRDCSGYSFCLLRQSLLHHGSFLPRRRRQIGAITLTCVAHPFGTE